MISRDPSEALQGLVHVFEGLGRYTDPGLPGNVMLALIKLAESQTDPFLLYALTVHGYTST